MGAEELRAAFLRASRAFLRDPSPEALATLLSRYALLHVAVHGSESGPSSLRYDEASLEAELAKIEAQCRQIMQGLP